MELKLIEALNEQANQELDNANIYLQLSSRMDEVGFKGAAHYFFIQYQEELFHGIKLINFIKTCGLNHRLRAINKPNDVYSSVTTLVEAFELALDAEKNNTAKINNLMKLAYECQEFKVVNFLNWYVDEQVEEEEHVSGYLDMAKLSNKNNDLLVDNELLTRVLDPMSAISQL